VKIKKVYSNKIKSKCDMRSSARNIGRYLSILGMRYINVKRKIFLTRAHNEKGGCIVKEVDYK